MAGSRIGAAAAGYAGEYTKSTAPLPPTSNTIATLEHLRQVVASCHARLDRIEMTVYGPRPENAEKEVLRGIPASCITSELDRLGGAMQHLEARLTDLADRL